MIVLLLSVLSAAVAVLAVVWLVYPLAIHWLASRRVADRSDGPIAAYRVDAIVATMGAPGDVADRVLDLLAADYPKELLRVIVSIDSRSQWAAQEYRVDDPRVLVVGGEGPAGKASALNRGVSASDADVLLFTDVAQRFHPSAISTLVRSLAEGPYGIVSGRLLLPADARSAIVRRYTEIELALRHAEAAIDSSVGVSGSIYAMWRRLWTPLPAGLILDDVYVPMRLVLQGERVGFANDAIAHETRRTTPAQEYRRKVRTLTGNLQLCAWLPSVLNPRRNRIWLQFVCHKLLRLLTPYCAALAGLSAAGLFVVLFPDYVRTAAIVVLGAAGVVLFSPDRVSAKVRAGVAEVAALQAAVVRATFNALRGQWDVWR